MDFNVRSESIDVEQIMEQIRARIREKRGVDSAEQEIQEQAKAKLAAFLDPAAAHADLIDQLRKVRPAYEPPQLPAYDFEDSTLYDSTRGLLRQIRRLLNPILKLFFNPNPLIRALHIQSRLNAMDAEREAKRDAMRLVSEQRQYELLHNLIVEMTRTGIETKNLRMRVESIASRLEFNERRTRSLESAMPYKASDAAVQVDRQVDRPARPPAPPAALPQPAGQPPSAGTTPQPGGVPGQPADGPGQRRRRRRRRGRRGGAGGPQISAPTASTNEGAAQPVPREDLQTFSGAATHQSEAEPPGEREPSAAPAAPPSDADTDQ